MNRSTLLGGALVIAVAAGAFWWTQGQAKPDATVSAAPLQPVGIGALGRVEPASRIRKLNQPGGMSMSRIATLLVNEGDTVAAGQVLATFADATQKDAATAQAEAQLRQSDASLARIRAAGRPEEIEAQSRHIDALRAAEEIAKRDATRAEALVPTAAGSAASAERNRFAAIRATAERGEAEATLRRLIAPRPEDIAVAEAERDAARAALAKARIDAELSRVTAPIGGTILKIYARPGDMLTSDGLLDLADLTRIDITADIYETDLPRLRAGAPADVIVPGETTRFAATVREIGWTVRRTVQAGTDPVAAVDARTVEVRLALDEPGRAALARRINMQVQVAIRP